VAQTGTYVRKPGASGGRRAFAVWPISVREEKRRVCEIPGANRPPTLTAVICRIIVVATNVLIAPRPDRTSMNTVTLYSEAWLSALEHQRSRGPAARTQKNLRAGKR
jgi:hypothetical protein